MKTRIFAFGVFVFLWISGTVTLPAQIIQPYQLHTRVEKTGDDTFNLYIEGDLEPGWHLYSQHNDPNGSSPLVLTWKDAGKAYELLGEAKEIGTEKAYNDIFGVTETFWSHKVKLVQKIRRKDPSLQKIGLHLEGQVCKEACIIINEDLDFELPAPTKTDQTAAPAQPGKKQPEKQDNIPNPKSQNSSGKQADAQPDTPQENQSQGKSATNENTANEHPPVSVTVSGQADTTTNKEADIKQTAGDDVQIQEPKKKGLWTIFLLSLLGGLIALLTPCIYPMIPLTISFFTKKHEHSFFGEQEKTKSTSGKFYALMYGFFIVAVYVLISLPFHLMDHVDPNIFNKIATNPWLNLAFFLIFVAFALSFMGVSRLDPQRLIPSRWISKSDEMSNKTGGLIAVFFMAITLILVSFSCTGPILGALLGSVLGSAQGAWALTVGFLGFGIGLALPFTIFALFPTMLKSMPRSGGWLNTVKVTLGFLELALAFKFLSNADLVLQLRLLEREVFLAIWIAIFFGLSLYLLGMFKLPYDDQSDRIGVGRLMTALLSLAFVFYMLPGLWGAPLKWISAFPPYQSYAESPHGVGCNGQASAAAHPTANNDLPPEAEYHYGGLLVFRNDYDAALRYAKQVNKPLMLDFTGQACVNCRKMENNVWTDPAVHSLMKDSLIIVSLYVDDKRELPPAEQYVSKYSGRKITTIGDRWAELEIYRYKSNSQPYYVLISPDEKLLNQPKAYEPDIQAYLAWLREGVSRHYNE